MKRYSFWDYQGRDPDELDALYYGNLHPDPKGAWVEVPCTLHSDYSGCLVEEANTKAFLQQFGEREGVKGVYGGYSTHGVVIHESLLEDEEIQEVIKALADYPLIDEDLHSALQLEREGEWLEDNRGDVREALEEAGIPYPEEDEAFDNAFWMIFRDGDLYFVHESAHGWPYLDVDKVVEKWQEVNCENCGTVEQAG